MKEKRIYYIVGCVLAVAIIIGGILIMKGVQKKGTSKEGSLTINGVALNNPVKILAGDKNHADGAELPLIEVLECLGAEVIWHNNFIADIIVKEKHYVFNMEEISLVEDGKTFNLLEAPPGGTSCYKVMDKELLLSDNIMASAFYLMDIRVIVHVDYKAATVTISNRSD